MDQPAVKAHWEDWARRYATDLRATTKTPTIKRLELAALEQAIRTHGRPGPGRVLEVGCGQGLNCLALARRFTEHTFIGLDYVAEMVAAAEVNRASEPDLAPRLAFRQGDALDLGPALPGEALFDVVFSDRMVINLGSWERQATAITALAARTTPGGLLLLLENTVEAHAAQNALRSHLGLPPRPVAEYNRFLPDGELGRLLAGFGEVLAIDEFAALHDLLLYVLIPATNGGTVDYQHPLVAAATDLSLGGVRANQGGQNRLYVVRRG